MSFSILWGLSWEIYIWQGSGDGLVSKPPAAQEWKPLFGSLGSPEKLGTVHSYSVSNGESEDSPVSQATQSVRDPDSKLIR